MYRRIALTIALAVSVISLSLPGSGSTAQAQGKRTYVYDSGIILLGVNQKLVVTVAANEDSDIVFREYAYGINVCNGTICKHSVLSENQSNPINLAIGEGASDTVAFSPTTLGSRITVTSKSPNLTVTSQIIDSLSGAIVSAYHDACVSM